jgi:hypothetical protein
MRIYQSLHREERDSTIFTALDSAAEWYGGKHVQITVARGSGRGPEDPTMLHVFLSVSVVLLFSDCTN